MMSSTPAIKAVKAQPHAFTWNIGTINKQRSRSLSPIELADVEAIE